MTKHLLIASLLVVTGAACTTARPDPLRALREEHCAGLTGSFDCARAVEHHLILNRTDVRRQGDRLTLVLANGRVRTFVDARAEGWGNTRIYSYAGALPVGYHVLHVQLYEGEAHLLVDSMTGKDTVSAGLPVLSPDRRRIVQTAFDGHQPGDMMIWRVEPQGLVSELQQSFPSDLWGPGVPAWNGPSRVTFALRCLDGTTRGSAAAVLRGTKWQVEGMQRQIVCP